MKKENGKIYFVVDAGMPGEPKISAHGDLYREPSQTLVDNFDTMADTIVESDFYTYEFDTLLSAYTPIYTSDRQMVGVLGVDITANTIVAKEREFLIRLILIYIASLPLMVIVGFTFANFLAKPIVGLRNVANSIREGDYTFKITQIPHTRELAELAVDFNQMSEKLSGLIYDLEQRVAERTESLTRKSNQLRAASHVARQTAEIQDLSARVRPTTWERVTSLQSLQREDLLRGFFEKQRRIAADRGARPAPSREYVRPDAAPRNAS